MPAAGAAVGDGAAIPGMLLAGADDGLGPKSHGMSNGPGDSGDAAALFARLLSGYQEAGVVPETVSKGFAMMSYKYWPVRSEASCGVGTCVPYTWPST